VKRRSVTLLSLKSPKVTRIGAFVRDFCDLCDAKPVLSLPKGPPFATGGACC
jgi:hypothetical protein